MTPPYSCPASPPKSVPLHTMGGVKGTPKASAESKVAGPKGHLEEGARGPKRGGKSPQSKLQLARGGRTPQVKMTRRGRAGAPRKQVAETQMYAKWERAGTRKYANGDAGRRASSRPSWRLARGSRAPRRIVTQILCHGTAQILVPPDGHLRVVRDEGHPRSQPRSFPEGGTPPVAAGRARC